MSSFLCSLKCLRYIGNVYKYIRINDGHMNFRNLLHLPNTVALQRSFLQSKGNDKSDMLYIDNIIRQMDDRFKTTGIISKSSIEKIIQHIVETADKDIQGDQQICPTLYMFDINNAWKIETSQALLTLCCSNLLALCTPQERVKIANTLWKLLNLYHIPIDVSHYNALLQVYIENRHEFAPTEILTNMKEQGISPNKDTYKCLLEYYCKNGNMSDSAVVLDCMKGENYSINESIFNLLILGYSQAGDLKSALNILDIMKTMDVVPTGETYTAIMCAYAKVNDIININAILSHYKKKGIQFLNEQILDVIYTLIINNNMDHVNEMFSKIEKLCFPAEINFLSKVMDTKQDVAMNIFFSILSKSQNEVNYNQLVYFFINKLIHNNVCPESIVEVCIHFETEYDDKKAFNKAIYCSFQNGNDVITLHLLKAWKNRGTKLRPHYFWPILTKFIKKNDIQGLLHNLKEMIITYNVMPCLNTLTDFIIPHVFYNILNIRDELHKYGIPAKIIDNAIVYKFLKHNKMRRASSYVTVNANVYQESILKDVLQQALYNTCDISSFFVILNNMYKETESGEKRKVNINEAILDIMNFISTRTSCIPQIIKYLYNNQLKISNDVYKALSFHLENNSSPDILQKLASITEDFSMKKEMLRMKQEQIKENDFMSQLMNSSTANDVMSLYRNFLILKKRNILISNYVYVKLVDCLLRENLREESKMIIQHLVADYPVSLTLMFVLKRTRNLISTGYFNDAAEILEDTLKRIKIDNDERLRFHTHTHLKNLLKYTTSEGNEKEVNILLNILLKAGYLQPSEKTLRPLIMVHINQGNAIKALETSKLLSKKYQYIPALTELTKSIVLTEDTKLLQRFIDITTKVYELQYILGELMLCFLENDYEKEAKRIIELLSTYNYKFTSIRANISKRVRKKNTKVLEKLLDCSIEYPGMNRLFIYKCLLHIYDINNDYQSGIHLWRKVIEEGLSPTEDFVKNFTHLIKRNNIDKSLISTKIWSV